MEPDNPPSAKQGKRERFLVYIAGRIRVALVVELQSHGTAVTHNKFIALQKLAMFYFKIKSKGKDLGASEIMKLVHKSARGAVYEFEAEPRRPREDRAKTFKTPSLSMGLFP